MKTIIEMNQKEINSISGGINFNECLNNTLSWAQKTIQSTGLKSGDVNLVIKDPIPLIITYAAGVASGIITFSLMRCCCTRHTKPQPIIKAD